MCFSYTKCVDSVARENEDKRTHSAFHCDTWSVQLWSGAVRVGSRSLISYIINRQSVFAVSYKFKGRS
jgi:hypothetical protein